MSYRGDAIVARIREGLYLAVQQSDEVIVSDIDSITFQKLLIKGVEGFNFEDEVTMSWYLDGKVIYSREANFENFGPRSSYRGASPAVRAMAGLPDKERVAEFYRNQIDPSLESIIEEDTFEFLRGYYTENAEEYRELYLANLDVAQAFDEVGEPLGKGEVEHESLESVLQEPVLNLQLEAEEFEELEPALDYFEQFVEALDQFVSWYENDFQESEIEPKSVGSVVGAFKIFYFEGAWRPIAIIVSRETADGVRSDALQNRRDSDLDAHFETFLEELADLRAVLADFGIDVDLVSSESWDEITESARREAAANDLDENVVDDAIEWARSQ